MYIQGKIRNNLNVYLWLKTKVHPWNGISYSDSKIMVSDNNKWPGWLMNTYNKMLCEKSRI